MYYFTKRWYDVETQKLRLSQQASTPQIAPEKRQSNAEKFFPLQIDAVQRLVLFLERIAPNNIIMRELNPGLPARAFQQKLLDSIRSEFEHNLAQQVYISSEAWDVVKQSKEEVVKIINMAATKLESTALAGDLAQKIFEITAQLKFQPTDQAIEMLKVELRKAI
ncbi:MAG: hypothetical protein R3279_11325 [Putridiphycobacter sp.]|nr:hypothetical protein [Putridiphycobacter sp.]